MEEAREGFSATIITVGLIVNNPGIFPELPDQYLTRSASRMITFTKKARQADRQAGKWQMAGEARRCQQIKTLDFRKVSE